MHPAQCRQIIRTSLYMVNTRSSCMRLLSPAAGAVVPVPVTLTWEKVPNALSYHVQVYPKMDSDPPYTPVYDTTGITTNSLVLTKLKATGYEFRYKWIVSAINAEGEGP